MSSPVMGFYGFSPLFWGKGTSFLRKLSKKLGKCPHMDAQGTDLHAHFSMRILLGFVEPPWCKA